MNIECIKVGFLRCNCYLLEKGNCCLIVDPGDDYNDIVKLIGNRKLIGILVTHSHFDHIGCVDELVSNYNVSVYSFDNLSEGINTIGEFKFEVIYTLGHAMDCVCFYFRDDKVMFTGDFLFKGTIGRCDLEGSDYNLMVKSINKIKKYDDDIVIYPGHGDSSVLGYEKNNNFYFK